MDYNVKPMIHRFRQNGMNIVMDVNSGIVHVVDDVTYKVLEFYNGKNRDMVLANLSSSYDVKESCRIYLPEVNAALSTREDEETDYSKFYQFCKKY